MATRVKHMIRILFVCAANICRSPAAEAITNHLIQENHLSDNISCDSAGLTASFMEAPADATMQAYAEARGYHLNSISRPITQEDIQDFDFILTMTDSIRQEISRNLHNGNNRTKIHNICEFCKYRPETDIPDPYLGDSDEAFEHVLDILEDACAGLIEMLKKKIN